MLEALSQSAQRSSDVKIAGRGVYARRAVTTSNEKPTAKEARHYSTTIIYLTGESQKQTHARKSNLKAINYCLNPS